MWKNLNKLQKVKYKEYCDVKYGKTIIFGKSKEPLYMDKSGYLIDTNIIIDLLFNHGMNQLN